MNYSPDHSEMELNGSPKQKGDGGDLAGGGECEILGGNMLLGQLSGGWAWEDRT